jgi:hypothetical protein
MSKRLRYIISSLLSSVAFYFFINLPYGSQYYGLLVGIVLIAFCFWFGLGITFSQTLYTRLMSIILPVGFFVGFALFTALLPQSFIVILFLSLFFGLVIYVMFLVGNVFLVSIGGRMPPLYRSAYTVGFMLLLVTSFFLFNSLFSFRFVYWLNSLLVFVVSTFIFLYLFYSVTIELVDDGADKPMWYYVLVPSFLISQLALVLSFWPVGILKGSIYLVAIIYIISSVLQMELRERFFKKSWLTFTWIFIAIILGMIFTTSWR